MIRTILFVLCAILLISSCRDSFDETGPDIIIEGDPIEVAPTSFVSQVRNEKGMPVSGASISIYLDNNLVEQSITDFNGSFSLSNVFTIPSGYRLVIEKEFYHQSFQLLDLSDPDFASNSFLIYSFESGVPPTQLSPFDLDLVSASGRILSNGEATESTFIHVYSESGEFLNYSGVRNDGSFELAVPAQTVFDLFVVDPCGDVLFEKTDQELNASEFLFESHLELEQKLVSLFGNIKTCEGDELNEEPLFLSLNDLYFDPIILDPNGNFEVEIFDCFLGDAIEYTIFSGPFATVANIFILPDDQSATVDLEEILLCDDSYSVMEIIVNETDSINFYNVLAFQAYDQFILTDINGGFSMEIEGDSDNDYEVRFLFIADESGFHNYESQNSKSLDIEFEIEYSEDTWDLTILEGYFEGSFIDAYSQEEVLIEGYFEIPLIK